MNVEADQQPPHPSTMTPRQLDRRKRLLQAGLSLLENYDYEQVQVKDIAEFAGVSLGTLYNYFFSKERFFAEVLVSWAENLPGHVRRRPSTEFTTSGRLKETVHRALWAFEQQPQMARLVNVLLMSDDPLATEMLIRLDQSTSDAYLQALAGIDTPTARRIVNVLNAVFGAELRVWSLGRRTMHQVHDDLDSAIALLMDAVAPAGQRILEVDTTQA